MFIYQRKIICIDARDKIGHARECLAKSMAAGLPADSLAKALVTIASAFTQNQSGQGPGNTTQPSSSATSVIINSSPVTGTFRPQNEGNNISTSSSSR